MTVTPQKIISLIDYTNLNDNDGVVAITQLCHHAITPLGPVAAVCIYPAFVNLAKQLLINSPVKIATVCNFPAGTARLENTLIEIKHALVAGADEIDVVMPYQAYLAGDIQYVKEFISQCKQACGNKLLKVILEIGALQKATVIEQASFDVIAAGADFIKTSTGKIDIGATVEAAAIMLSAIKNSGANVGFKAAGGIRSLNDAQTYLQLAEQIMGISWPAPQTFRLGTSKLLQSILDK